MVAGLLKVAGFGPGLAGVCPGFGKGLTRVWLKGFVSGIGCRTAEDIDRKVHGLVLPWYAGKPSEIRRQE